MAVVVGLDFAAVGYADDSFHAYRIDVSKVAPVVPAPLVYGNAHGVFSSDLPVCNVRLPAALPFFLRRFADFPLRPVRCV